MNQAESWALAVKLFQQGNFSQAKAVCKSFNNLRKIPQVLTLLGHCEKKLGDFSASEGYFRDALALQPANHELRNSLANVLQSTRQFQQAETIYTEVLKADKANFDAIYNLARLYMETDRFDKALTAYRQALSIRSADENALLGELLSLQQQEELEVVAQHFEKLHERYPKNLNFVLCHLHYLRDKSLFEQAIVLCTQMLEQYPSVVAFNLELAYCYMQRGEVKQARSNFEQVLTVEQGNLDAIQGLSNLEWLSGQDKSFAIYEKFISQQPEHQGLKIQYAQRLIKADELEKASALLDSMSSSSGFNLAVETMLGYVQRELGDLQKGLWTHRQAAKHTSENVELQKELATSLLVNGLFEEAYQVLNKLVKAQPEDRGLLAYLSTAMKLSGREAEYANLHDYQSFVRPIKIQCPNGYQSLAAFNRALKSDLETMHAKWEKHPLEQSLRHGTQTQGNLFDLPMRTVQQLKSAIQQAVGSYIQELPFKPGHPLLAYVKHELDFSCSWSVKLKPSGFHRNHFHHKGWISSAYYVNLPDEVSQQGQGWVKFGQPEISRHLQMEPDYMIKPEEGCLVLFPSYMWHGTAPFISDNYRMTVAFDVVAGHTV